MERSSVNEGKYMFYMYLQPDWYSFHVNIFERVQAVERLEVVNTILPAPPPSAPSFLLVPFFI